MKIFKNIPLDIYLKIFFDSGVIWKYSKQINYSYLNNKYLYSFGIGIDLVENNRIEFFLLLLLLLLPWNKFAHFLQIAITQPTFELGPPDFVW